MNHGLTCVSSLAVWLHQTRIGLSLYDVAGQGYLRESVSNLILPSETVNISIHNIFFGVKLYWLKERLQCATLFLQDLENYILELIPTLPQLDGLEKSFYSFYVCTAVRKFFFFLDPLHTGNSPVVVLFFKFLTLPLNSSQSTCRHHSDFILWKNWNETNHSNVLYLFCREDKNSRHPGLQFLRWPTWGSVQILAQVNLWYILI